MAGLLFVLSLGLYMRTLAPTVATLFDDSLEFQLAAPILAIGHPTGYPVYLLLGFLFSRLVPLGDAAFRVNLLSAVAAAVAVALLYLVARELVGQRLAAFLGVSVFAVSPVWWQQANIAEVYTLQAALMAGMLLALLRWETHGKPLRWLLLAALLAGFGLAHHRTTVLWGPAVALFVLWAQPSLSRRPIQLLAVIGCLLAPLLFYLYLPLRGQVGSLDGSYVNSWKGFWDWVLARQYNAFLEGNPLDQQRSANDYFSLVQAQVGGIALGLAFVGLLNWRWQPRRWALIGVAVVSHWWFAVNYHTADIEVLFIPVVMLLCLLVAAGLSPVLDSLRAILAVIVRRSGGLPGQPRTWFVRFNVVLAALVLAQPVAQTVIAWPSLDRSANLDIWRYGQDIMSQPLGERATVIGILGEMTLIRYFQRLQGEQPHLQTIAADAEDSRRAAVSAAVAAGRQTYITRSLPGLDQSYSLSAVGPLIAVHTKGMGQAPPPAIQINAQIAPAVHLLGANVITQRLWGQRQARVVLTWQADSAPLPAYKMSVRLLGADDKVLTAVDALPVHFTYPTPSWAAGEQVVDAYDLVVPANVRAGAYRILVIVYRPADGSEFGRYTLENIPIDE